MDAFWVVWNPAYGQPTVRHPNEGAAVREAERLARSDPGREFFVLQAKSRSIKADVVTEKLDDLPF